MENVGLTTIQALELLKKYGPNEIEEKRRKSAFSIFIDQFANFLVILLIFAAIISFFFGDVLDGVFILLIVILNAILGFIQEFKAEKAVEALKRITISKIIVLRDGKETEVDSKNLVPGDIFFVEEGVKIPADGNILEAFNLELNESSLTGESLPVSKKVVQEADEGKVFSGTVVSRGRGTVLITATGTNSRFGKIALQLSNISQEETPLQRRIRSLGKQLGILGLTASALVFVLALFRQNSFFDSVLISISLSVAAVPEGLPAVITIALAVGMQRMSRQKAIIRRMTAVEALGSTSVILTDKTGTLTRNEMRVKEVFYGDSRFSIKDLEHEQRVDPILNEIFKVSALCNNAKISTTENSVSVLGDTTEGALLLMLNSLGVDFRNIQQQGKLIEEHPFDGIRKVMSVVVDFNGRVDVYSKGAPETLLRLSSKIWKEEGITDLDTTQKNLIEEEFKKSASSGLRMIAFSKKSLEQSSTSKDRDSVESDLTFLGFVGIYDPPREEVKSAIQTCKEAGIRVVMVTGDNSLTAKAIAAEIGLIEEGEQVVEGYALETLSEKELIAILPTTRIFARTTPEQKFRIVKAYRSASETVAVTGDGVNDALALKQADVGVAMGITGTDVAKEASDVIITDDNFASIAKAVEEGRVIFDNVKGSVKYLIACNIGEVLAVLAGVLFNLPLVLTPLQLLYVNLITDGLPALALAVSPKSSSVMKSAPRKSGGILGFSDLPWFIEISLLTAIPTLTVFYLGLPSSLDDARSLAFTVIILVQHFVFLDVWAKSSTIFNISLWKNKFFLFSFILPLVLQPMLFAVPFLSQAFNLSLARLDLLIFGILLSFIPLISSEIREKLTKGRNA